MERYSGGSIVLPLSLGWGRGLGMVQEGLVCIISFGTGIRSLGRKIWLATESVGAVGWWGSGVGYLTILNKKNLSASRCTGGVGKRRNLAVGKTTR